MQPQIIITECQSTATSGAVNQERNASGLAGLGVCRFEVQLQTSPCLISSPSLDKLSNQWEQLLLHLNKKKTCSVLTLRGSRPHAELNHCTQRPSRNPSHEAAVSTFQQATRYTCSMWGLTGAIDRDPARLTGLQDKQWKIKVNHFFFILAETANRRAWPNVSWFY